MEENLIDEFPEATDPSKRPSTWMIVGMTVIGFPLIGAIVLCLATGSLGPHHRGPAEETRLTIRQINGICLDYFNDFGALPPSENYRIVKAFSGGNTKHTVYFRSEPHLVNENHEFIDGWGTPLRFRMTSKEDFLIKSAGPDEIFNTPDDITNR